MRNNNPFDNLYYAEQSHRARFRLRGIVLAVGMMTLSLIVITILMKQEWFVHYVIHVPCLSLKDPRYITLLNSATHDDCGRCLEVKQRALALLSPEERQLVKQRDEENIRRARLAAQGEVEMQKQLEIARRKMADECFRRDLNDH
jgi:predicted tellurium resistance membrane protein TerC